MLSYKAAEIFPKKKSIVFFFNILDFKLFYEHHLKGKERKVLLVGIVAVVGSCPISFLQIELCLTVHCSAQCSPKQCLLPGLSSTEIRIFQIIIILSPCPTPCNFIRRRCLGVDTCSHLTSLTSDKSPTSPTDLCHSVPGGSPNMVRL